MIELALTGRVGPDFILDVQFTLPAAGVTALLGPSGSGKTTLLRALAGLDRHPGTIRFAGEPWQDRDTFLPPHRRGVGYAFQGAGLLPHLTVRDNLRYATRRAGAGPFSFDEVVRRTAVAALLDRSPSRLSGGEGQRASLARALLTQPRLLLLDEPLSGLDGSSRRTLLDELQSLLAALPLPAFYVTHDDDEAARFASRTLHLRHGRLEG